MSTFSCPVVQIDKVERHPNADSLILCHIGGYVCISSDISPGVERYKAGDYVVYIPEASVLPDWILKKLGFWKEDEGRGSLSGSWGNRVKAIKLRGVVSQGIMFPVVVDSERLTLEVPNGEGISHIHDISKDEDVSEILGIKKFEPEIPTQMAGYCGALYGYTKSYDIDSLQGAMRTFEEGEEVVVTEKLHGTLAQFGFIRNLPEDKQNDLWKIADDVHAYATSKGQGKKGLIQKNNNENKDNVYVSVFQNLFVDTKRTDLIVEGFMSEDATLIQGDQIDAVYVFGEIFGQGIQKGYAYGKPFKCFSVFDVYVKYHDGTGEYLDDDLLDNFCSVTGLTRVPVLYRGPYNYDKMVELRDGKTVEGAGSHIREGIVIRTAKEREQKGLPDNRAQVKFVSPEYLLKSTGDEIS